MTRTQIIQAIFDNSGRMKRLMHSQSSPLFDKSSLSPAQLDVLMYIHHNQPINHKALASKMGLTPGAVSQLLDGMDTEGLIARQPSPTDRRVSYLSVSRSGKRKLDDINKRRQQIFTDAYSVLNDQELEIYARVQQELINWFEKESK